MVAKRIGQQDVADALGVARSTVTKVLNHDPVYRVSAEMKEIIWEKAREMGYTARKRRSNNIALIIASEMMVGYYKLHIRACEEAASLNNRLFLVNTDPMPSYRQLSLSVNPLSADGAILLGDFADDVIAKFTEIMPIVLLDERPCAVPVDRIYCSFSTMAGKMATHLIDSGHTRIALIVSTLHDQIGWDAVMGLNSVLQDAGIEPDSSLVWERMASSPPRILREIVDHPAHPTAIINMTDVQHGTFLSVLEATGYEVPGDMSYVGLSSNDARTLWHYPELTSLHGYHEAQARIGVRRLMERIDNRLLQPESILAPTEIRLGGTCARLPRKSISVDRPGATRSVKS